MGPPHPRPDFEVFLHAKQWQFAGRTAQKEEKTGCEEVWRDVCHGLTFEGTVGAEDREDRINLKR